MRSPVPSFPSEGLHKSGRADLFFIYFRKERQQVQICVVEAPGASLWAGLAPRVSQRVGVSWSAGPSRVCACMCVHAFSRFCNSRQIYSANTPQRWRLHLFFSSSSTELLFLRETPPPQPELQLLPSSSPTTHCCFYFPPSAITPQPPLWVFI